MSRFSGVHLSSLCCWESPCSCRPKECLTFKPDLSSSCYSTQIIGIWTGIKWETNSSSSLSEVIIWRVASLDYQLQPQFRHNKVRGLLTTTFEVVRNQPLATRRQRKSKWLNFALSLDSHQICHLLLPETKVISELDPLESRLDKLSTSLEDVLQSSAALLIDAEWSHNVFVHRCGFHFYILWSENAKGGFSITSLPSTIIN